MKIEQKKAEVTSLADKLRGARAFYLTDFTGLDVKSMTDLRARLRKADVEYLVVKNTMAVRAAEQAEMSGLGEHFKGPTGLVIGRENAVMAAKVLDEFAREHDDKPSVKVGVVERQTLDPTEVGRLAKLPPKEQLLAELAGAMEAPMAALAYMMQGLLSEFVGVLEALRQEREGS